MMYAFVNVFLPPWAMLLYIITELSFFFLCGQILNKKLLCLDVWFIFGLFCHLFRWMCFSP